MVTPQQSHGAPGNQTLWDTLPQTPQIHASCGRTRNKTLDNGWRFERPGAMDEGGLPDGDAGVYTGAIRSGFWIWSRAQVMYFN